MQVHDLDLAFIYRSGVDERFQDGFISVLKFYVFTDQSNQHFTFRVFKFIQEGPPFIEFWCCVSVDLQFLQYDHIQSFLQHLQRYFINGIGIYRLNDCIGFYVAEQGYLFLNFIIEWLLGAADDHIGVNTFLAQHAYAVLGGFGLQFFGGFQVGDEGKVYNHAVLFRHFPLQLAYGLNEGQTLDITHCSADLSDDDVVLAFLTQELYPSLDLIGDMRYYLYGLAQVVAFSFFVYNGLVYTARGHIVGLRGGDVQEAFIMSQVQVGLCPVVRNETFAVFVGVERTGIHIDVRIEFLYGDFQPPAL